MTLNITDNCLSCKYSRIRPVEELINNSDIKDVNKTLYCVKYKGEYSHRHPEDWCLLFEAAVSRKGAGE